MIRRTEDPPLTSDGRGAHCAYCHRALLPTGGQSPLTATRDHVVPRAHGGSRRVWACAQCNTLKGCMSYADWRRFMMAHPEWWTLRRFQLGKSVHSLKTEEAWRDARNAGGNVSLLANPKAALAMLAERDKRRAAKRAAKSGDTGA